MLSESAKATSAAEARFRIEAPNSKGRSTLVLALDGGSLSRLAKVAGQDWRAARFRGVGALADGGRRAAAADAGETRVGLISLDGKESDLLDELQGTDVVILVAQSGASVEAAEAIGKACFARHIMTSGFIFDSRRDEEALERTLARMRPYVICLVVGFDDDSLVDVLTALRA